MLLCDSCPHAWHIYCLTPPLPVVPAGDAPWFCPCCAEAVPRHFQKYLYLVKWKSLSYADATWETVDCINNLAKICEFYQRQTRPQPVAALGPSHGREEIVFMESPVFLNGHLLRSYQLEGLNWLVSNWDHQRNCLLADEMGLGKTIQVVSFLNWLVTVRRNRGPFLIVAPLSTLPFWQREVETWTHMNAIVYHGDKQSRDLIYQHEFFFQDDHGNTCKKSFKWHLLLTSPEIVLQDVQLLKNIQWEVLICDEAQVLIGFI